MSEIKGKYALVTGSSRGIGQQIAIGLAGLGCHVILHGRTKKSCTKSQELLRDSGVKTFMVYGELSDEESVRDIIRQVRELAVPIDILYNNAAVMSPEQSNFWHHEWKDWMALSFQPVPE